MAEKCLYLVFRDLSGSELDEIKSQVQSDNAIVFSKKSLEIESQLFPAEIQKRSTEDLYKRVVRFAHEHKIHGENIIEANAYNEFYPYFIARSAAFRKAVEFANQVAILEHFQHEHPEFRISLYTDIIADFPGEVNVNAAKRQKENTQQSSSVTFATVFLARSIIGLFQMMGKRQRNVIAYSPPKDIPVVGLDGKMTKGDHIFGYLISRASASKSFSIISVLKNFNKAVEFSFRQNVLSEIYRGYHFIEVYMLLVLFNPFVLVRLIGYRRKLQFQNAPFHSENLIDRMIFSEIKKQRPQFWLMAWRYEATRFFLAWNKPKSITCGNEHSYTKYPMIQAANRIGVPTFGLQHGGISGQNVFYTFDTRDTSYKPLTKYLFAWGEYLKKRLVEHSIYPESSLLVCGQPRTDVIPILNSLNRQESKKPTVLYASQLPVNNEEVSDRMLRDVFKFQAENEGFNVIVKPHPREYGNLGRFDQLAGEKGVEANISTDDLYLLLGKADIVITYYSTAGAEAIYFDKELIVFDYNKEDIARYYADGVAHMCSTYQELSDAINSIAEKSALDLSSSRKSYRDKRVHKIDGQRTKEILETIQNLSA